MRAFKDLTSGYLSSEHFVGCRARHDTVILEKISIGDMSKVDDSLSSLLVQANSDLGRETILFRVLHVGPDISDISVGDIVCTDFMTGDSMSNSNIVICKSRDISFVWGDGIYGEE
jgi:hypothetical protein